MHIPYFSNPSTSSHHSQPSRRSISGLTRRKGGGGKGGGGGSSKGGSGESGSSSSSSGRTSSVSVPNLSGSGKSSATSYGSGGGKVVSIPSGQLFAGRQEGGGTRDQVYGSSVYGSGYPGVSGRGVTNRGFPFYFWPVIWGGSVGAGSGAYLHDQDEYGTPDNSSRPGGAMMQAAIVSNSSTTSSGNITTFHLLADNTTLASLLTSLQSNCSTVYNSSLTSTSPQTYLGSSSSDPQPEQAIQYYRASSVVLTLDGYNNSAALSSDENATQSSLPGNLDQTLLGCLNDTVGLAAPLVDAALPSFHVGSMAGLVGLMWLLLSVERWMF